MQWVSTFASGASSLGRSRHLAAYPAASGPPSLGIIRRELPSYTKRPQKRKTSPDFSACFHLMVGVVRKNTSC